ncbi:MAG: hypothetical protein PWQ43_24 [Rikenellaceae bacterium]|nr:hypothetical protein [Rikenellaceae bacterium]
MDDIIELIKKQGFVNIPFGRLNLVYNEAKVHYDSMLIYPPYYSIDFIANEELDTFDFISPKYNEWGSFVNIDNKIQYIPDAELIEKLNASFYGLQPVPIKIHKSLKAEIDNSIKDKNKDTTIDSTANLKKVKQKKNIEKNPKEKKEKLKKQEKISLPTKEKVKKEKISKTKKIKVKDQPVFLEENPIIEIDDNSKKKSKHKTLIVIIVFILILVAGGAYYYENYINISNEKFLPLNDKLNYKELAIVVEQKLYQLPQFDTMRYYLIIASKTTINSAKKESARYNSLGFSPIILYDSIIKRYRVAIDSFSSRDTILMNTKLEEIRTKYKKDAWILKKRIGNG